VIDHPAPFPEEIPYRLISLYSYPGDIVLDPFAGSGQVLKVAKALGRDYLGYEIFPQYLELAEHRLDEPLNIRPQQLYAAFGKVELEEPLDHAINRRGHEDT
jgi:site-specific DNA-methyltransferase (adenine-specific)